MFYESLRIGYVSIENDLALYIQILKKKKKKKKKSIGKVQPKRVTNFYGLQNSTFLEWHWTRNIGKINFKEFGIDHFLICSVEQTRH